MLVAELQALGPVSASNAHLQERLGLTRSRLAQVFSQLEDAGLVRSFAAPTDRPRRPAKLYQLATAHEAAQ